MQYSYMGNSTTMAYSLQWEKPVWEISVCDIFWHQHTCSAFACAFFLFTITHFWHLRQDWLCCAAVCLIIAYLGLAEDRATHLSQQVCENMFSCYHEKLYFCWGCWNNVNQQRPSVLIPLVESQHGHPARQMYHSSSVHIFPWRPLGTVR